MEPIISIELKVISCRDLKAFNFFQKLSVYSVISVVMDDDDDLKKKNSNSNSNNKKGQRLLLQRQKTPVDRDGNGNPDWNHEIRFDLKGLSLADCSCLILKFEMRCEGGKIIRLGKNGTIGEVCVPVKDLINESNNNGTVRFVSYQVRTSTDGKPNGVLNFCYKVNTISGMTTKNNSSTTVSGSGSGSGRGRGRDSPAAVTELDLTTAIQFPTEKVCYPSVEVDYTTTPDICYPLSEIIPPSGNFNYGSSKEVCDHKSLPPPLPPPMRTYWVWYHSPPPLPPPPPLPSLVQSSAPDSYYRHNYGLWGYPTNTIDGGAWRN